MKEKTNFDASSLQVVVELTLTKPRQNFGRFHFYDHPIVYQHIEPVSRQIFALVSDIDCGLECDGVSTTRELTMESQNVNVFQKSVAEVVVNLEESTDHRPRQVCLLEVRAHPRRI